MLEVSQARKLLATINKDLFGRDTILEIRQLNMDDLDGAADLANDVFRDHKGIAMEKAFPQIFKPNGDVHSFGAFDQGKLVSFIGLVPQTIKLGPSILYCFALGSVCTAPSHRGQGISTKLLHTVYDYVERSGASLLFVSGDRGMYARNHCYYFGGVEAYHLDKENVGVAAADITVRRAEKTDMFALHGLRQRKAVDYESTIMEWSTLYHAGGITSIHEQGQVCYLAERAGQKLAYVVIGANMDGSPTSNAYVTEWAGNWEAIQAILATMIHEGRTEKIQLHVPWYEGQHPFQPLTGEKQTHGGTLHLVNHDRLVEQLLAYLQAKQLSSIKIVEKEAHLFELALEQTHLELSEEALLTYLFTPGDAFAERHPAFPIPLPNPESIYFI